MKTPEHRRSTARVLLALTVIVPAALTALVYASAAHPRLVAAERAHARATLLQTRLVELQAAAREAPAAPVVAGQGPQREFERRTSEDDRLLDVIETLVRLANGTAERAVQDLSIETGDRVEAPVRNLTTAPGLIGAQAERLDPRLDLFRTPVTYVPVTISFQATYSRLGEFFWNLRNLPTTIELRSLDIAPAAEAPLLRVTLTLFSFQRSGPGTSRQSVLFSTGGGRIRGAEGRP